MSKCEIFAKSRVRSFLRLSFCRRLEDGTGFVVWPGPIQSIGFEKAAIGFGKTANKAWMDAERNIDGRKK
jgi:hypothetical protein